MDLHWNRLGMTQGSLSRWAWGSRPGQMLPGSSPWGVPVEAAPPGAPDPHGPEDL